MTECRRQSTRPALTAEKTALKSKPMGKEAVPEDRDKYSGVSEGKRGGEVAARLELRQSRERDVAIRSESPTEHSDLRLGDKRQLVIAPTQYLLNSLGILGRGKKKKKKV